MNKVYLKKAFWPDLINYGIIIWGEFSHSTKTNVSLPNNNNYDLGIPPDQILSTNLGN